MGVHRSGNVLTQSSSNSLKINPGVRNQLLTSVPSASALQRMAQWGDSSDDPIPHLDESEYDVGLTLPFNEVSFDAACKTPLGAPDRDEELYLEGPMTPTTKPRGQQEKFTPGPLQVDHGIAMLEESVESGVPDVITQV